MLVTSGTVSTRDMINIEKRVHKKNKMPWTLPRFHQTKRLGWVESLTVNWCLFFKILMYFPSWQALNFWVPSWMTLRILGCSPGADFPHRNCLRGPFPKSVRQTSIEIWRLGTGGNFTAKAGQWCGCSSNSWYLDFEILIPCDGDMSFLKSSLTLD